jgi:hypothetical protein
MTACFETIKVLLGTRNFALCLLQLHLVQGEFGTSGGGVRICLSTGIHGGAGADEAFCGAALGVCGTLRLLVELGQGELEELVHLLGIALLTGKDLSEDAAA